MDMMGAKKKSLEDLIGMMDGHMLGKLKKKTPDVTAISVDAVPASDKLKALGDAKPDDVATKLSDLVPGAGGDAEEKAEGEGGDHELLKQLMAMYLKEEGSEDAGK